MRHAKEVMDRAVRVLPADTSFDEFLRRPENEGKIRHVVVTRDGRIVGVQRVNMALRRGLEAGPTNVTLGDIARTNFTVAREEDVVFDVIRRMWRRGASMAVVIKGTGVPRARDVVRALSKGPVAGAAPGITPASRTAG